MAGFALPLSVSVHAKQLDAVDEVCNAALGCGQSNLLWHLAVLVLTGLVAVFVLAAVQHVSQARRRATEERSRTATEQDAFSRFARHVARIEPTQPAYQLAPATGGVSTATMEGPTHAADGLEAVRSAYERTVMSTPHYEEEYDEPLARHMGAEFGEEVATAVADGDRLTAPLKEVLLDRSREAARDRERLISRLEREVEALDEADTQLSSVSATVDEALTRPVEEMRFPQLADEWNRLGELESRLSRLLSRRQESLQANAVSGTRHPSLNDYLYGGFETQFPVLADGAAVADRVKDARTRVLSVLTSRA